MPPPEHFETAWPRFEARYGERFHRMWRYYLLACAGTFRSRSNQLWQIVMSPRGVPGGYPRHDERHRTSTCATTLAPRTNAPHQWLTAMD